MDIRDSEAQEAWRPGPGVKDATGAAALTHHHHQREAAALCLEVGEVFSRRRACHHRKLKVPASELCTSVVHCGCEQLVWLSPMPTLSFSRSTCWIELDQVWDQVGQFSTLGSVLSRCIET